jgi:hypothetical protein
VFTTIEEVVPFVLPQPVADAVIVYTPASDVVMEATLALALVALVIVALACVHNSV